MIISTMMANIQILTSFAKNTCVTDMREKPQLLASGTCGALFRGNNILSNTYAVPTGAPHFLS